ncbi:MAG: heme exporter protein CcmD [Lentilitoribacter sp.]|jgi:heme exporter protein D
MSHEMFVFLSYAAVVVVLGIVICWIIFDGKARKAELARLEAAGVKRRSEQNT